MKERISALMDGELDEHAAGEAIEALKRGGEAIDTWRTYHLISDAMRDTRLLSAGFGTRLGERLAAEPPLLAPGSLGRRSAAPRFALAAAASLAAVALVGWLAFAPRPQAPQPLAQLRPAATASAAAPAPQPVVVVPLPSTANDYLLAHQGFSPHVSFQGMAPYVRTVAEQPDAAGK